MKTFRILFLIFISFLLFQQDVLCQLNEPTRDASASIVGSTADARICPYTSIIDSSGVLFMYWLDLSVPSGKLSKSTDNGDTWIFVGTMTENSSSHFFRESVIKVGSTWYSSYHRTSPSPCVTFTATSTNGYNFTATNSGSPLFNSGEDRSLIYNTDSNKFYCYIRPKVDTMRRLIGLTKSSNFTSWTSIDTILKVDISDFNNTSSIDFRKQFYSMTVVRNGADWWGLVNVLHNNDSGTGIDKYQDPSTYKDNDQTVEVQLVHSSDGINWRRCNNRQAFITRVSGIKECFGVPTIIGNEMWIYTFESERRHTYYDDNHINGRYFNIWRYKISLTDLNEWRPPVELNLKTAIEGFYNTSNNKLIITDTVSVKIRNSVSPFNLVKTIKSRIDSVLYTGSFNLESIEPGNYYIVVEGRNCVETWSNGSIYIGSVDSISYDFTSSSSQAYGNNQILKNSTYCIYSGDINQDGNVNYTDVLEVFGDVSNGTTGYVDTDLSGNYIVDLSDLNIAYNNSNNFVAVVKP